MKLFPGLAIITAIAFTTGAQADPVNYQNGFDKLNYRAVKYPAVSFRQLPYSILKTHLP
jgi:hypothetical protein